MAKRKHPKQGPAGVGAGQGRTVTIAERRSRPASRWVTGLQVVGTEQVYVFAGLVKSAALAHWFIVGRDPGCDIPLDDATVTRSHCFIQWTENKTLVRDHNSKNRTLINGVPLEDGRGELLPGFVLELGNTELIAVGTSGEVEPHILAQRKSVFASKALRYYPTERKANAGTGVARNTLKRWVKEGELKVRVR